MTTLSDYARFALYAVVVCLALSLYQIWEHEHPPVPVSTPAANTEMHENNYVPDKIVTPHTESTPAAIKNAAPVTEASGQIIKVKTDMVEVNIDTLGGNITEVKLLKYNESRDSTMPYVLLNDTSKNRYIAQSGLLGNIGPDTSKGQALYTTEKTQYQLATDEKELHVKLYWQNNEGLKITKIFTFRPDNYEIDVKYEINNASKAPWDGNLYLQLMRTDTPPPNGQGLANLATYFGAAISSAQKPYEKISFKDMTKQNVNKTITGGWAALIQHYFVSAWVPESALTSQYYSRVTPDGLYTIGLMNPKMTVAAGESAATSAKFYAGPSISDLLEKVAPKLQLTIDYGLFWFLSAPIFWLMQKIHNVVGNWGWSIVFVTVIIKLLFYHLSAKSYRSMSAMKKIQPKLAELKERFADDKQKFTQATIDLYKKEKVNPMSGCLPILVQIPVFIALYWVLVESVQLRHAPFILWIHDLSTKDPYYVLPVLMGLSMLVQQRLSPPPPDPTQAKVMMMMPIIFTVLFINMPAGLMLYWFVNNTLSVLQQWYIMRSVNTNDEKPKKLVAK